MARNVPEGIAGESAVRTLWTGILNKLKSLKTSDITNDGDGTSAFATESYVGSHGGKIDTISFNGSNVPIDSNKNAAIAVSDASTSTSGLMSSSDKTKLNSIATNAEVNQNAFSNVKVGSSTIAANSKTDTVELAAGSNITLTPDTTNDKVTIAATDTTYTFTSGTNSFKVTPSGGSAQTINVTPSITNNVTGSGTNGYIAKFNGTNTVTNGPAIGSATNTYLRNDGTWASPASEVTFSLGTGWTGSSAPYSQTVSVSGITTSTIGIVAVASTATEAQYKAAAKAQLRCTAQGTNSITMSAYGTVPTVNIPCVVTILKA